jgi:hypothetical protein
MLRAVYVRQRVLLRKQHRHPPLECEFGQDAKLTHARAFWTHGVVRAHLDLRRALGVPDRVEKRYARSHAPIFEAVWSSIAACLLRQSIATLENLSGQKAVEERVGDHRVCKVR